MIEAIVFLAIAVCLLALLLLREHFGPRPMPVRERESNSQSIFEVLELKLPSRTLSDRVFAIEDWDFVCREAPLLRKILLRERKAIAVLLLRQTRRQVAQIFQFHRIATRTAANLNVTMEVTIAASYVAFLVAFLAALGLVHLLGPFRLRRVAVQVFAMADRMCVAVGGTLSALDSSALARIKDDSSRRYNPAG
jgi:hypothetical protein